MPFLVKICRTSASLYTASLKNLITVRNLNRQTCIYCRESINFPYVMTLFTHLLSGAWFKNKLIKINILPKINYVTYERWHQIVIHHPPFTDNYIYNSYIGLTLLYWCIKRMLFTSQCPEEWNLHIQKKRIRNTMSF